MGVWNRKSGKLHSVLNGHEKRINFALFTSDNSKILTASDDKTVRLWDASSGKELYRIHADTPIQTAFFSDDEKYIFASSHPTKSKLSTFEPEIMRSVSFLNDENLIPVSRDPSKNSMIEFFEYHFKESIYLYWRRPFVH